MIRAVAGILFRDNKVLVAERPPNKPYAGYWEFPGGKIEEGEQGLDAIKRELHEELGIEVMSARHCFDHTHQYPDKKVLLEVWLISEFSGELHGKEQQVLRWVTMTEIESLRVLEGNWSILEQIKGLVSC